mgnify:CR=1 FL=1
MPVNCTKAAEFLDNMRARLASRPAYQHRELIETNIAAFQYRHVEMQRWAASDEDRPNPFAGWTAFSIEEVLRALDLMKSEIAAPISVAAE